MTASIALRNLDDAITDAKSRPLTPRRKPVASDDSGARYLDRIAVANSPDGVVRRELPEGWKPEPSHKGHRASLRTAWGACDDCYRQLVQRNLMSHNVHVRDKTRAFVEAHPQCES